MAGDSHAPLFSSTTNSNSHRSDWKASKTLSEEKGERSSAVQWWLNHYWRSGDGKARKPRQMFGQTEWLQEKMKARLPRHLVSVNCLSRAAAEPSAGVDSLEARSLPYLRAPQHAPSRGLALRRERRTLAHLTPSKLGGQQRQWPRDTLWGCSHRMWPLPSGKVNWHQGELTHYQVSVILKETLYKAWVLLEKCNF